MAIWDDKEAFWEVQRRVDPDRQQPDRLEWERRMFRNLAFYSGIQHFSQDPISGRLFPLRDVQGKKRLDFMANLILPTVSRSVSKITNLKGTFQVAPNSGSRQDREASKIAEKVFNHIRHDKDFRRKRSKATLWAANTGAGFLKFSWDPDAGEPERIYLMSPEEKALFGFENEGQVAAPPGLTPEEQQAKERDGLFEDVPQGDVKIDVLSPYSVYWDPDSKDEGIDGCNWMAVKTLMDLDAIKKRWPEKGDQVVPDNFIGYNTLYEESISLFHGGQASIGRTVPGREREVKNRATVVEFFERPSPENDFKGRYAVIAGRETTLENRDNPYVAAGVPIPVVMFEWLPRAGGFVSVDLTGQLTDVQRAYNRSNQHMLDMEESNGWPMLVTYKGSGVKSHRIPNYPGAVLEVNQSYQPPTQIPPAQLPPYIANNVEYRRREMHDISSSGNVAAGDTGQIRGSRAIEMLIGEDNQVLNTIATAQLDSIADCGKIILALAGAFYDSRKVLKTLGDGGDWDVTSFTGADLRGSYDVVVTGEPARVDSGSVRQAIVMELVQAGFLNPANPRDHSLVMEALYLKMPDQPYEEMLIDRHNAERENEHLLRIATTIAAAGPEAVPMVMSEIPEVRDFQDHQAHMDAHNRLRKTRDYRELPPHSQQLIDQHIAGHQQYAAAELEQQIEMQQLMTQSGGQPKPAGQASNPKPQTQ